MGTQLTTLQVVGTTSTGTDTVVGDSVSGFARFDRIFIDATLTNTGTGTVDVYVQRRIGTTTLWRDWIHWPQLTAGVGTVHYSCAARDRYTIISVGTGSSPALADSTMVGGHPGASLRLKIAQAGAGTHPAQTQTVYVTGRQDRHG